ncbi:uncharacterized protein LOC143299368 [Babylonia areolata]|uniref:uncharacterized protein LOC143299368 n=1 Tax=Babylonia areolata TaxID=304850 RepID=UPI003FD12FF9
MTVETLVMMDELPSLSFKSKYSPKTQMYPQQGTVSGNLDRHGAMSQAVSRGVSCSICGQHFIEEHRLDLHQKVVHGNATSLKSLLLNTDGSQNEPNVAGNRLSQNHANNFSGHCTRNQKRLYRAFALNRARAGLKKLPKWDDSRPVHAFWAPKRSCVASPERHPSCSVGQDDFMSQCGLVSSTSAVDIKANSEKHEDVNLDCQIVAVTGLVCDEPLQSPRTTRSLMSQLSRENAEAVRKRLSFCLDSEDQEGSESETLDSAAARRSVQVSLLAIDFSSPLGQRLKKHMKGDLVVPPITDIEQHCMTIPVLDEMAAKLRHRANEYPIMHRKRKGIVTGYCHTFKFNSAERREFLRTLKTGLNARSRRLLRQTKKSAVRLTRLRAEVIRYWTVKRRTIVNEEITIDDDLSIVQVDVPEHLFNAVRKMSVPSQRPMHYRDQPMDGKYFPSQEAYPMAYQSMAASGPRQLSSHSQMNHHLSYSYPSSSSSGPVPQFLVKQVSKNWTENGQESQKLVFVPLAEAGHSQHPNVSVRNMAGGSTQRPFPKSSSGIKKSLPRHLRPCPKSQRKRQPDREDSGEEFVIETASSSSDEDHDSSVRCKTSENQESGVYPLSLSRAREMVSSSSWGMADRPVPQMLHVANSTSAGVPVSGLMPFPTGMVPVSPWEHHMEPLSGGGLKPLGRGLSSTTESVDQHAELRKHLTMFTSGSTAASSLLKPVDEEAEDNRSLTGVNMSRDGVPHHSAGGVHRAGDYHKQHAAATSSRHVAPVQPNFLQIPPDLPKLYDSSQRDHQSRPQHTGHQALASSSHVNSKPPLLQGPSQLPVSNQSLKQQQALAKNSSGAHHPNILRGPGKMQSAAGVAASTVSGGKTSVVNKMCNVETKLSSSNKVRSSSDWTVIRASDDDVVEVICIDDDD